MSAVYSKDDKGVGIKLKCNCGSSTSDVSLVDIKLIAGGHMSDPDSVVPVWHCNVCGHMYSGRTAFMRKNIEHLESKKSITHVKETESPDELSSLKHSIEDFKLE